MDGEMSTVMTVAQEEKEEQNITPLTEVSSNPQVGIEKLKEAHQKILEKTTGKSKDVLWNKSQGQMKLLMWCKL